MAINRPLELIQSSITVIPLACSSRCSALSRTALSTSSGIRIKTKLIQGECHVPSRREHRRRHLLDGNGTGSTSSRFLPSSRARLLRHPARPRCIHSGLKPPVPHRSGGGTVPVVGQETQPLMSYETPPAEKRQCRSCGTVLTLNFFRLDHLECRYCEGKRLADLRDSSSEET